MFIGTYDPDATILLLNDLPVFGFADGESIVVERNEDFTNELVGIKGDVARAINRNATGTLTFTLMHNSPFVQVIEAMAHADYPPVVNFGMQDPSSFESFGSSQCWLKTDASHSWSNEVGSREYVFFATNIRRGSPTNNVIGALAYAANRGLGS